MEMLILFYFSSVCLRPPSSSLQVKENPVKIRDGSRGKNILAKEPKFSVDFTERPDADAPSRKIKLVRFPENPQNWGPLAKAKR